jgi:hypothetical protein
MFGCESVAGIVQAFLHPQGSDVVENKQCIQGLL